jgi:hypothetical protein
MHYDMLLLLCWPFAVGVSAAVDHAVADVLAVAGVPGFPFNVLTTLLLLDSLTVTRATAFAVFSFCCWRLLLLLASLTFPALCCWRRCYNLLH